MNRKTSFELFIGFWNAQHHAKTPHLHRHMAAWLSRRARSNHKRLLLMAFRGSGKSTLVGLFCVWLLLNDPELRILIVAADEELAEQMVRHIRSVLETHPLTQGLVPAKREQWASDRLTIARQSAARDPSVRAAGITSNITGARADIVICDDVEVPKTCDTAWKREQLRLKLQELDFILTPDGMILYIGTPHAEDSLYKKHGFLSSYKRLKLPLKETSWPERFTRELIQKIKRAVGPRVFASQMKLQPMQITKARLDANKIGFYDTEPKNIIAHRCYWDPAFGHGGDNSIIALVLFDTERKAYIHDLLLLKVVTDNQAADQCRQVIAFLKMHHLKTLTIEGNGLGQFLPGLLRQMLRDENYSCAVQVVNNSKPKAIRILQAFEARLAANALHAHERVRHVGLIEEMKDWQPGQSKTRDDRLDAIAGALLMEPTLTKTKQFYLQEADI